MTPWTSFLANPDGITAIFPTSPSLDRIRLIELCLNEDGPDLKQRINLADYPEKPPAKWAAAKANRVQLHLRFSALRQCQIAGWSTDNIAKITLTKTSEGFLSARIEGVTLKIDAEFSFLMVDKISAYQDTAPAP